MTDDSQSHSRSTEDSLLVQVLDEHLAALAAGHAPTQEELLAVHPELANELRACLPSLEFLHQVDLTPTDLSALATSESEPFHRTLGDFRLLREIGRGGMGVVYEAEQVSLSRRVALKILPFAGALDSQQRKRFQKEALAAASLHHTNIVPVHAVGCERGVNFYAMQFIEGRTLAQFINDLKQEQKQRSFDLRLSAEARSSKLEVRTSPRLQARSVIRRRSCPALPATATTIKASPGWACKSPKHWNTRTSRGSSTAPSNPPI
jgi:eukaryotic-like serine/threonine-protein kinase